MDLSLEDIKQMAQQTVSEIRGIIDIVKEDNVGIHGISLGGMSASIAYGIDDRLKSASVALTGGNLADTIMDSDDRFARYLRSILPEDMSRDKLREELKGIEPCNFVAPDKADTMFFVSASEDKDIPDSSSTALQKAWGVTNGYSIRAGHRSYIKIITALPRILKACFEHHQKYLLK